MSTTYSSSTKESSAAKDSSKDKDSSDTYVRDATESSKTATGKSGKTATFESSTANNNSDRSHDIDITSSSYGYGKDSSKPSGGQYGQGQGQSGQRSSQLDQDSDQQYRRGGQQQQSQVDVQQKLKEVGSLLQKAGHLLQDLQGSSASDFQVQQGYPRQSAGNYGGPFGGQESCYGRPCQTSMCRPSGEWSQYESQQRGPKPQSGRWSEDREERDMFGRGNMYSSSRYEDRFPMSGRQERSSVDRFGGFGGPNRPDLAYGQQYGLQGQQYGQQSGLGYRGEERSSRRPYGMEERDNGDTEFSPRR